MRERKQTEHDALSTRPNPTYPIASDVPNALTVTGLGLGIVRGKPGAWTFEGVGEGAYVMCRQETERGGLIRGPKWVRYGRTTWNGWVVEREEEALDEQIPQSGKSNYKPIARNDLMLLYPDERYRLYWSFDRDAFMAVKDGLEQHVHDLEPARVQALEFEFIRLAPARLDALELIPWLLDQKKLEEHCRDILANHLLCSQRGYVRQKTTDPQGAVAMLDVTPTPLRALLLVEFLQWYALMATERSGEHLAALHRACSLIKASETGAPDAVMEARVSERLARPGTPERARFEKYRTYAWKCAAAKEVAADFLDTLPTVLAQVRAREPDLRWEDLAKGTRARTARAASGPAEHPALDAAVQGAPAAKRDDLRLKFLLTEHSLEFVKNYFDLYTLGVGLKDEPVAGRGALLAPLVEDFEREWQATRNEFLPKACRALLSAHAPYVAFVPILSQVEANEQRRLTLLERYFDACALANHPWWRSLSEAREVAAEASLWSHLAPSVTWLGATLDASGKTLSGLVESRLAAHTLAFTEAHELLEALFRHEIALAGTDPVNPQRHYLARVSPEPGAGPNFRAQIDLMDGKLTVTREVPLPDAPASISFELLERVEGGPEFRPGPPQSSSAYRLAKRVRAKYSTHLVVPIDLAELKQRHTQLPKEFARCAEIVNLAHAAASIADDLSSGKGLATPLAMTWRITKGVVALVDSYQAALKAMQRPLEAETFVMPSKLGGVTLVSTVFGGLDGVVNIGSACNLLFSEDGDLAYELRQERAGRASVVAVKGAFQFAAGVMGVIAATPATAALAATGVGLAIAVGAGIVVAALDVALDATQEFTDHAEAFRRALDTAKRTELDQRAFRCSVVTRAAIQHVASTL